MSEQEKARPKTRAERIRAEIDKLQREIRLGGGVPDAAQNSQLSRLEEELRKENEPIYDNFIW